MDAGNNMEKQGEIHPLMTCEALQMLEERQMRLSEMGKPRRYMEFFESVLEYVERCAKIRTRGRAETLRGMLGKLGLDAKEVADMGTLLPQGVDEAKMLIPELCRFSEEELVSIVQQVEDT